MSKLVISNLHHRNNENFAVQIDHQEVDAGKIICLLGPSGCGKSTTLRLAAGLENPDAGDIFIGGDRVAGKGVFVSAEDRQVGLVFQDYALFPHLTVLGNVTFGLREKSAKDRKSIASSILQKMGLAKFADKYPHMLSGGEQQRVALARALAPNPRIILMDEPFSGLDVVLRNQVRDDTLELLKETGTTVLLVTHDPEEAMRMADQIVLMKDGRIEQQGTPADLYSRPNSEFVASFLGDVNRIKAEANGDVLETELGRIPLKNAHIMSGKCEVLVRPEAIRLGKVNGKSDPTALVLQSRNLGPFSLIELELPSGSRVTARAATILQPEDGATCAISLDQRQVFLFPSDTTR
ncbi:MAG: ABC transporter ATP-binding protein [Sneathiella sp.]|nr:ABC transporter ATP-binding protein [Sneathiella sp.]